MSKKITLKNGNVIFSIMPKPSYSPTMICVMFYINREGNIISESLQVIFDGTFPNFVSEILFKNSYKNVSLQVDLKLEENFTYPNTLLGLNINSMKNSSINLSMMPKSSQSCDEYNEFNLNTELSKYDFIPKHYFHFDKEIPLWFYPSSYQKKFLSLNMHIISNAIQEIPCKDSLNASDMIEKYSITEQDEIEEDYLSMDNKCIHDDSYGDKKLFTALKMNLNDNQNFTVLSPLSSSSKAWILKGISMHQKYGIGLTTVPVDLNIIQPFDIEMFTASKVKVNEVALIEIVLTNTGINQLPVEVEFLFTKNSALKVLRSNYFNWTSDEFRIFQDVEIPPQAITRLEIEVTSLVKGTGNLKFLASTSSETKIVKGKINFVPEGFLVEEIKTRLVDLSNCENNRLISFECSLPNSTAILSVFGDVMGLILSNLDQRVKIPTGSALHNLFKFSSDILLLDYLVLTEQLTPVLKMKALLYLQQFYEKLLMFRNFDGSFMENTRNPQKSLWMTAKVIKFLRHGRRYLKIDEEIFLEALAYISSMQGVDGQFECIDCYGEKSSDIFTAIIASILDEFSQIYPKYQSVVRKSIAFVENNYNFSDIYSLAVCTHLLFQTDSDSEHKYVLFKKFASQAIVTSEHIYWQASKSKITQTDVLVSAYGLLIFNQIPDLYGEAFKIYSWIISQSTKLKFQSIDSSIICLEAVSKFASRFINITTYLEVKHESQKFLVKSTTRLIQQTFEVFY